MCGYIFLEHQMESCFSLWNKEKTGMTHQHTKTWKPNATTVNIHLSLTMAQRTKAVNNKTKQKLWKFPAWLKLLCMCKEKHCSPVSTAKGCVWTLFNWLNLKGMGPGILLEIWSAQEETLKTKHGDLIPSCERLIHFPFGQLGMWEKAELSKEIIFNSERVPRQNGLHFKSTCAAWCMEACTTGRQNKSAGRQPKRTLPWTYGIQKR